MNPHFGDKVWEIKISEKETDIFGLSFEPQMIDYSNDDEYAPWLFCGFSKEVSEKNYQLVDRISTSHMTHGILEIGVNRNGQESFTQALLKNKPDNIPYLGVDLDDKSYLNSESKNIFTLKENSFNHQKVREYIGQIGMKSISILLIDGDHSVNAVINDWKYSDLLSDNGIVIFHDTNYHPGPLVFMESINKEIFKVEKHFVGELDYGVSIAFKK